MVSLLGSRDELLHVIEGSFDADIHVRGNEITITGTPAQTALVAQLFEEMTAMLSGGAELSPSVVERIITMLHRKSGVRPAEVLSLDILSSRGRTIRPKTLNQKRYVDAIDEHTIVFCIGPAGTGKTYLAMAKAVKALQAKEVNRIILTRPAVEAGERLGFLPGTLYEKIDPYLRPRMYASGLRLVQEILEGVEDIQFARLTSHDVVRHRLVGDIVNAYAAYEARTGGDAGPVRDGSLRGRAGERGAGRAGPRGPRKRAQ